jgi:ribose 5-phosphate isomerase A
MTADDMKCAVGEAAVDLVHAGMTIGLGSGSTAACFVRALAARKLALTCVATSEATAALARHGGMTVVDLDAVSRIDLTIDGADEIGPGLVLIKGGGAALLREKLVWEASDRCVVIADDSKRAARFGTFPLPVEVVAYGHATTARRMARALEQSGFEVPCVLRGTTGAPILTDSGNVIYDIAFGAIDDPEGVEAMLKSLTGVVEHGLFIGLAFEALIATPSGVVTVKA